MPSDNLTLELLRSVVRPVIAKAALPSPDVIRQTIDEFRGLPSLAVSDEEAEQLARDIESQLEINMTLGSVIQEQGFVEWYPAAKAGIDPIYWERYRILLEQKGFAPQVLATLDQVTDRITGLLENPNRDGPWDRRGMVVGHVQSGKTANYTGLICKAADAGYKLIVVIAGIHNNLRNQTQQRIDEGFVGRDSSHPKRPPIGVGKFSRQSTPITLTTATSDFNAAGAGIAGMELKASTVPVVLVIKKNSNTLKNLITWLKAHNTGLMSEFVDAPMLLIDDEADNASINTSANPGEAPRINALIRELLNLFRRKCYVGYTATPFANIFVDPDTEHDMLKADLFPRDFIITLDPPTNYFGAAKIFQTDEGKAHLRDIDDNGDILPIVHKIDFRVVDLPETLLEAVRTFVVARAIRILRGQGRAHTSMLVNASRFTNVQKQLRNHIHEYVKKLERAIRYEAAMEDTSPHILALKQTWKKEYGGLEFSWKNIKGVLLESIAPIQVVEVNSGSAGNLDYADHAENGLQVIAVGGFSLSRGLTLEGLTVSYFLRNSIMYDTLLQMGRWFGYRPGYEDLCRIWMPVEAQGWYEHISESIDELRDEMRRMEQAKLTPKDFGLKVRSHPDSLIVTARNKMRTAESVNVSIGLSNEFIETYALSANPDHVTANFNSAKDLVATLVSRSGVPERNRGNYLWTDVPADDVVLFIERFINHQRSLHTSSKPVADFIRAGMSGELSSWDVAVVGRNTGSTDVLKADELGLELYCQERTLGKAWRAGDFYLVGNKSRVSSRGIERIGISEEMQRSAEESYRQGKSGSEPINYPDRIFRDVRQRPLLLIQPLDLRTDEESRDPQRVSQVAVIAWSISFPRTKFEHRAATYAVNRTWWREYFGGDSDEDEGASDEAA
ncbi:Z1 domain-containing protein [Microvirga yunnanensis]|uniref:Z1 domain-containing protein n=1 Tax=Microvirga yunnanensis TaxID=2953740 RepID=UPI0021C73BFD|nr:Z1 domain-containing protein [Microvirga sp. HBU65207]